MPASTRSIARNALAALATSAAFCLTLPACQGYERNDRLPLGSKVVPHALHLEHVGPATAPIDATTQADVAPGASLASSGASPARRTDWPVTIVLAPVDGVVHGPIYTRDIEFGSSGYRDAARYPKRPAWALSTQPRQPRHALLDAAVAPLIATTDVVLLPLRMLLTPPWTNVQSPAHSHERARPGPWYSAGGVMPAPASAPAPQEPTP